MMMNLDIVIVDDEKDIGSLIADALSDQGYQTRTATDSTELSTLIKQREPHLVILDIWLKDSPQDGLEILDILRKDYPKITVIMISGHANIETAISALRRGAYDFIEKPFKEDHLIHRVARALETVSLKEENATLRKKELSDVPLIGQSSVMRTLMQSIAKVAPTSSRVLISGATGTGKNSIAHAIHQQSKRAEHPFITCNLASLTTQQAIELLFGSAQQTGLLAQADNGTLFIDDIADMPRDVQGIFVKFLQDKQLVLPHNSSHQLLDVRVIAATSYNLPSAIKHGLLREDLYYRLNVVPLHSPSLAERREDTPLFCNHYMSQAAALTGLPERSIADDTLLTLQSYAWPGNFPQLHNVIEWLLIMAPGEAVDPITSNMLPPDLLSSESSSTYQDLTHSMMSKPLREARELFEREYLRTQLTRFNSNVSRTAHFIGMERSALHRKLKSLEIHQEELVN
jgi:two-component system nitrogen regulation response regulator NtrX